MAKWPPLPMKDVVDGHERSLSPSPSPQGGGARRESLRDFHGKVSKESTPRFAALRVPELGLAAWAAAQLALAARTRRELLRSSNSARRHPPSGQAKLGGEEGKTCPNPTLPRLPGREVFFPYSSPIFRAAFWGSRRALSEPRRGELRSRPNAARKIGHPQGDESGRPSFGYFSWPNKKSNWLPGHSRPTAPNIPIQSSQATNENA